MKLILKSKKPPKSNGTHNINECIFEGKGILPIFKQIAKHNK